MACAEPLKCLALGIVFNLLPSRLDSAHTGCQLGSGRAYWLLLRALYQDLRLATARNVMLTPIGVSSLTFTLDRAKPKVKVFKLREEELTAAEK